MKNTCLIFILFLSAAITLNSCKKKEEAVVDTELAKLPAATQVGANKIGCLVNGKALLPKTQFGSGDTGYQCEYIYMKGDYFFNVAYGDESDLNNIYSVSLSTDSLALTEGQTYDLKVFGKPKNACGRYAHLYGLGSIDEYMTNDIVTGKLKITKLDQSKQIVAGTFFFNAIRIKGDTVRVTDGRFDMKYTM